MCLLCSRQTRVFLQPLAYQAQCLIKNADLAEVALVYDDRQKCMTEDKRTNWCYLSLVHCVHSPQFPNGCS